MPNSMVIILILVDVFIISQRFFKKYIKNILVHLIWTTSSPAIP